MNHSGIGEINSNGDLFLPSDILSPLSISTDTRIWGMYYPCSSHIEPESQKQVKYDFMISPIPFDHWGRVVRIKVRLKPIENALKRITEIIMNLGGSILLSELSRSAHHYDTATFIITFTDLSDEQVTEYGIGSVPSTKVKANYLQDQLKLKCRDLIYEEKCDEEKKCDKENSEVIRISSYQALAYFYNVAKKKSDRNCSCKEEFGAFEVFTLTCTDQGYLVSEDALFNDILRHINNNDSLTIQPCNVFCELDTNDINIRLVLIPKEEEKNFFHVTASYRSSGSADKNFSKGFINHVVSSFPENYVIWRMSNSIKRLETKYDEGVTRFFIKDSHVKSRLDRKNDLELRIQTNMPDYLAQLHDLRVEVSPLRPARLGNRLESMTYRKEYDVFISFSNKDKVLAEYIYERICAINYNCFLSKKDIISGDEFGDEIKDALRSSTELVLLITENSLKSAWVQRECGAAWALGMKIAPILYNISLKVYKSSFFQHIQACEYEQLDKYLDELQDRYSQK